ncbi:HAD family hydrolase [Granulosicoccus sp.]|nr:HAD family hydrolase [Granulosicoccus sp.]MDB4223462.1 HAD family hydrolase [Granulosicoccus sp.]
MNLNDKTFWMFDMDGTLTQAMHDFDEMRAQLNLPAGVPILEALDAMEPDEAAAKHQELDEMELRMAADAKPQPGCVELLDALLEKGASLGIVTRNGKQIAEVTLAACGIDHYFTPSTIISRDCCTPKPDPAGVNLLLSLWQADPSKAVMVGDYIFDLQTGHSAGVATVHLDVTKVFPWPELTDVSVSTLSELQTHIS